MCISQTCQSSWFRPGDEDSFLLKFTLLLIFITPGVTNLGEADLNSIYMAWNTISKCLEGSKILPKWEQGRVWGRCWWVGPPSQIPQLDFPAAVTASKFHHSINTLLLSSWWFSRLTTISGMSDNLSMHGYCCVPFMVVWHEMSKVKTETLTTTNSTNNCKLQMSQKELRFSTLENKKQETYNGIHSKWIIK